MDEFLGCTWALTVVEATPVTGTAVWACVGVAAAWGVLGVLAVVVAWSAFECQGRLAGLTLRVRVSPQGWGIVAGTRVKGGGCWGGRSARSAHGCGFRAWRG